MQIDQNLIKKLEKLSKLQLSASEKEKITADLERMILMVEKMNELDTTSVEPLVYMTDEYNVLRADVVKNEIPNDAALQNAPQAEKPYFKVPKVIDL
jgi:aspartyl-tRNA(Asn)/glutamyl-tRNA(Gln) amidotransferase subunit C